MRQAAKDHNSSAALTNSLILSKQMAKAIVTSVSIGNVEVQGLMLPHGEFAIGVSQVAELFSVPQKNTSRNFKALMGEGFQFLRAQAGES